MLNLRAHWTAKCEKHPRYDPEKHGKGGIKAGCERCWELWELYQHVRYWVSSSQGELVRPKRSAA